MEVTWVLLAGLPGTGKSTLARAQSDSGANTTAKAAAFTITERLPLFVRFAAEYLKGHLTWELSKRFTDLFAGVNEPWKGDTPYLLVIPEVLRSLEKKGDHSTAKLARMLSLLDSAGVPRSLFADCELGEKMG